VTARKPRIVRLLPTLDFGGVESRATLQSELYDRDRFDLRICTFHRAGAAAEAIRSMHVPVDVLGHDPAVRNVRATLALRRYLADQRPDIVHASIVEANFHALVRPPSLGPRPKLIVEEVGTPEHGRLARGAFSLLYRRADRIVGVSQATCDYLTKVDRAPAPRVRLIYNCAAQRFFADDAKQRPSFVQRRREGRPFRMLLVGRLVPVKNQAIIIRAMPALLQRHPNVELWVAGEGPLAAELEQLAHRLGVGRAVRFLGFCADVRPLLLDADLFLLPSLSEGCSISLVEALASGLPALGSAVPGIAEVLGNLAPDWTLPAEQGEAWQARLVEVAGRDAADLDNVAEVGRRIAFERFSPFAYMSAVQGMYGDLFGELSASQEKG
jgi:glycosyltransferase involved in cell wall biosynthesis